ncbi:MAG TPA: MFS transporter [Candidatus Dormibacteraeota bacterium]|nr:MFS transporter [Candidatus Dormibacteraeota bacterium]
MAVAIDRRDEAVAMSGRRWTALAFVALAQLMVALDATIVSIALPSAQRALHASDAERQWVVTAYTLAFGCLLLLGGRVADAVGRKRAFLAGLAGFAIASAAGGAAPAFPVLVAARALQGAFAAVLAPTALSLLAVMFTEPLERAKAFAVYGTIAGSGAVVGLLLGGVLTQYLAWRWCLYVNVPIAVVAAAGGWIALSDPGRGSGRLGFDMPGVLLAGGALAALVSACTDAVSAGWGSRTVVGLMAICAALLVLFVLREANAASPLLPLRILRHRARGGAYAAVALAIAGMFGAFFFLTYYLQVVLRYTPLEAGLAFLPMTAASQLGSWAIASRLMPFVPPRALMAPGALVAAAGMGVLTLVQANGDYLSHVLPAEILLGMGIACVMVPAFSTATLGVDPGEAGVASAIVNAAQQVGGSTGTALLNTIAAGATAGYLATHDPGPAVRALALVHGYSVAAGAGTAILAAAALVAAILINAGRPARGLAGQAAGGSSR